jgi:hypothetical protein
MDAGMMLSDAQRVGRVLASPILGGLHIAISESEIPTGTTQQGETARDRQPSSRNPRPAGVPYLMPHFLGLSSQFGAASTTSSLTFQ